MKVDNKIAVKRIIGSKFNGIFRCVDMLIFDLGNNIKDLDGDIVPEFSFHIQTQWRFIREDSILLASRDIYIPYNTDIDDSDWEYDVVNRDDGESSIFDVIQKRFYENFLNTVVSFAEISQLGDLKITFSNGIIFETFTPSMRQDEFYRVICYNENAESEHFIVFD